MDATFFKLESMLMSSSLPAEEQKIIHERFSQLLPGERLRLIGVLRQYPTILGVLKNLLGATDAKTFEIELDRALSSLK